MEDLEMIELLTKPFEIKSQEFVVAAESKKMYMEKRKQERKIQRAIEELRIQRREPSLIDRVLGWIF
jgi:hypothetical protein